MQCIPKPMHLRLKEAYCALILVYSLSITISLVSMKAISKLARLYVPVSRSKFHSNAFLRAAKQLSGDDEGISIAAAELRGGKLVAFPTETVYGLGADAFNADAVQRIFTTKQRPNSDPLIVHVSNTDMIHNLYDFQDAKNAASVCELLTKAFWPGPLTIIYKAQSTVPSVITAGTGFVGVRCPKHPIALALIHEAGIPIAAPSANRFGHVSPTSAQHVMDDLGHSDISIITDDNAVTGGCSIGVESTVCRISKDGCQVSILRCGAVTVNMLQNALHAGNMHDCAVIVDNERHLKNKAEDIHTNESATTTTTGTSNVHVVENEVETNQEAAVAPGQMLKHYAPDLPTFIVRDANTYISAHANQGHNTIQTAMVIDFGGQLALLKDTARHYVDLSIRGSAAEACVALFDVLRRSESEEVRQLGVTHVLLPDLSRFAHIADATKRNGIDTNNISYSPLSENTTDDVNNNHDIKNNSEDNDGLRSALWERMHRAASGTFV